MALLAIGRVRIGMAMAATVVVRHRAVNGIVGERVLGGADLVLHARAGHLAEHGRSHCAPDGEQDDQHKQQPDAEGFHDGRLLREGLIGRTGTQVLSPLRILEEQCEGGESESVSRGFDKHQDRPHPLLRGSAPQELKMRHLLAVAAAVLSTAALAQAPASGQDHAAHHPSGASAPAPAFKGPANKSPNAVASKAATDATMKSMREMHDKMMAAKTLEERHALMADHMKVMQDGMAMMGRMKGAKPDGGMGGGMSMSPETMGTRMDMMEMMMQMMVDREAARPPPAAK